MCKHIACSRRSDRWRDDRPPGRHRRPDFETLVAFYTGVMRFEIEQRRDSAVGLIHAIRGAAPRITAAPSPVYRANLVPDLRPGPWSPPRECSSRDPGKGTRTRTGTDPVDAVAPGLIDTPLLGDSTRPKRRMGHRKLPVERIGRADEVAQAVMLLMSNDYITGEVLHVDGGGRYVITSLAGARLPSTRSPPSTGDPEIHRIPVRLPLQVPTRIRPAIWSSAVLLDRLLFRYLLPVSAPLSSARLVELLQPVKTSQPPTVSMAGGCQQSIGSRSPLGHVGL